MCFFVSSLIRMQREAYSHVTTSKLQTLSFTKPFIYLITFQLFFFLMEKLMEQLESSLNYRSPIIYHFKMLTLSQEKKYSVLNNFIFQNVTERSLKSYLFALFIKLISTLKQDFPLTLQLDNVQNSLFETIVSIFMLK